MQTQLEIRNAHIADALLISSLILNVAHCFSPRSGGDVASWFLNSIKPLAIERGLGSDMMVVSDVGDRLFAAVELRVHHASQFLASVFYTSMGFATPAAWGAQVARPNCRALILVGDGAFQMTGAELSIAARLKLNPIVIVFNNKGYSTERYILEGPFNNIASWRFDKLGEVMGPMNGYDVQDENSSKRHGTVRWPPLIGPLF